MSSFLTYQGPFTTVLRILDCITSILFIWLIGAVPHTSVRPDWFYDRFIYF